MALNKISFNLYQIKSPSMDSNTYLLLKDKKVIIIDPSFAGREIIDFLNKGYELEAIILTHAHFDHCFDVKKVLNAYDCPVYLHINDQETYKRYNYCFWADSQLDEFDKNLVYIKDNELVLKDFTFKIFNTPGHTPGSICIIYDDYAFVGDTLFYDSYGRTDLTNSSDSDMKKSLAFLWKTLKDNNLVLPGHGAYGNFKNIKEINIFAAMMFK